MNPLLERYVVETNAGCWEWQRNRDSRGYGRYRGTGAHRWVYQQLVGPIPADLELDHLCRNPPCVNPAHLEPVTHAENVRRGHEALGTGPYTTHCPVGHPYDAANTYFKPGTQHRACKICRAATRDAWVTAMPDDERRRWRRESSDRRRAALRAQGLTREGTPYVVGPRHTLTADERAAAVAMFTTGATKKQVAAELSISLATAYELAKRAS